MAMNEEVKKAFDALNIGDVLVSSYSYSMTLYDFYKVVGKTACSLKLQQLKKNYLGNWNSSYCPVAPIEETVGEVITKRPDKWGYLNFPYHYCSVSSVYKNENTYAEDHMD